MYVYVYVYVYVYIYMMYAIQFLGPVMAFVIMITLSLLQLVNVRHIHVFYMETPFSPCQKYSP